MIAILSCNEAYLRLLLHSMGYKETGFPELVIFWDDRREEPPPWLYACPVVVRVTELLTDFGRRYKQKAIQRNLQIFRKHPLIAKLLIPWFMFDRFEEDASGFLYLDDDVYCFHPEQIYNDAFHGHMPMITRDPFCRYDETKSSHKKDFLEFAKIFDVYLSVVDYNRKGTYNSGVFTFPFSLIRNYILYLKRFLSENYFANLFAEISKSNIHVRNLAWFHEQRFLTFFFRKMSADIFGRSEVMTLLNDKLDLDVLRQQGLPVFGHYCSWNKVEHHVQLSKRIAK